MARAQAPVYALNGGEVGKESVQRLDVDKMRFSGELYENILPKVIGSFQFRGGFGYKVTVPVNEAGNVFAQFVKGDAENALLHFSSDGMRIFDADTSAYLARASVSTAITSGDFNAFTGWTDESDAGASAAVSGGFLVLTGTAGGKATARQAVTVSASDDTVEHGIEIDVSVGPIGLRIGTTAGGEELLSFSGLEEGFHNIAFTPGDTITTVYIELMNVEDKEAKVDSCMISAAGGIVVEHPWATSELSSLKYDQSGDVLFVASSTKQQRRIERRGQTSWSVVRYKTADGPFDILPDESVSLTCDTQTGNGTLTASEPIFTVDDVGSLYRLIHFSQFAEASFTAGAQTSDSIVVTGSGAEDRTFSYSISGTWVGTVSLDRSVGNDADFSSFREFTANVDTTLNDGLNNSIVYYRWRMVAFTSGTAEVELDYEGGVTQGVVRVLEFTDASTLEAEVLSPLAETTSTTQWDRGSWSDARGWPTSVAFFDGRLWWGRSGVVYGSTSDAFDKYDDLSDEDLGDSAPVVRSIGTNTTDGILWLLGLQRLAAGTTMSEISIRASSFDEPITASNFVPRVASTRGSKNVQAVRIDSEGVYVQRSSQRAYRFAYDTNRNDYFSFELTKFHREILDGGGIVRMAVQRYPDTRIWFLLENGEARVLVYEIEEQVLAWTRVTMSGAVIEDIAILPANGEDRVFALVQRTINSSTVRYIEEMAPLSSAVGATQNLMADSFVSGIQASSTTISGLSHLEGEDVVVWADGKALHDQDDMLTVSSASITVSAAVVDYVVGLPYTGKWTSTDLAYGSQLGTALTQRKRVSHLGLVMNNVSLEGIRIGKSFTSRDLRKIRQELRGETVVGTDVLSVYNYDATSFGGGWSTDSRVNIEMKAPYPATVAAMVLSMKTNDMAG